MADTADPGKQKPRRPNPVAKALAFHQGFRARIEEDKRKNARRKSRGKIAPDALEE
jgi:hypothetical protein